MRFLLRRDLRKKKKSKPAPNEPERPKRARSKAFIIKPAEGVSYAAILKNLKSRVNPEVKCAAENRGRLHSVFRGVVGKSGSVRNLVPTVEVEILDVDPTVK